MLPLDGKYFLVTPPAAEVDNAPVPTSLIDTLGANYLEVIVIVGDIDIALTVLKVSQGDLANGSDQADIPGSTYGGANLPALPGAGDDNKLFGFGINLIGKKRYIDVQATIGDGATGAFVTILARLSRLDQHPDTPVKRGFAAQIVIP